MADVSFASKGSQRWLQMAIAHAPDALRASLVESGAVGPDEDLVWTAPLASDGFAEPRDAEALAKAGVPPLPVRSLEDYWPRRGPVWDAVGRAGKASVFLEAKSHAREAMSPPSQATPESLKRIQAALAEARAFYAPGSTADWHLTFYQYANRLAHHYLLTRINGLDSRLVFLCFLNDAEMQGPSEIHEWQAVTAGIHAALGLPADLSGLRVHHAYLDVRVVSGPK